LAKFEDRKPGQLYLEAGQDDEPMRCMMRSPYVLKRRLYDIWDISLQANFCGPGDTSEKRHCDGIVLVGLPDDRHRPQAIAAAKPVVE